MGLNLVNFSLAPALIVTGQLVHLASDRGAGLRLAVLCIANPQFELARFHATAQIQSAKRQPCWWYPEGHLHALTRFERNPLVSQQLGYWPVHRSSHILAEQLHHVSTGTLAHIGYGHRRIGFLGGRSDLDSAAQRELGFRDALRNSGITPDESLIVSGDFRPAGAVLATEALLGHANRPTAIFAANDSMALQAIDFARRMNLRVPEDISVIGFDNIPEAASSAIPLTTVSQPMQMMGKEAVRVMVDLLAGRTTPLEIKLPTELKVRASCGPVPN